MPADPPSPISAAADSALDGRVRQLVEAHGGGVDVAVDDAGVAQVTFKGRCRACPSAPVTLHALVTPRLLEVPGVKNVRSHGAVSPYVVERISRMFGFPAHCEDGQ